MATQELITDHAFVQDSAVPGACGHVFTDSDSRMAGKCWRGADYHERRDAVVQAATARIFIKRPGQTPMELMLEAMNHHCPGCNHLYAKDIANITASEIPEGVAWYDVEEGGWAAFKAHLQQCIADHPEVFNKGGTNGA